MVRSDVVGCSTCGLVQQVDPLPPGKRAECPRCGAIVKPDVVMFGELLPAAAIDRSYELARSTRLLLVVGSTLEVWPVSMLPEETLAAGGAVAVVNRGPTSIDDRAAVRWDGAAGESLAALVRELG